MQKLIIFGTGKVGQVLYAYLKDSNKYDVCAFCCDQDYLTQENLFDLPVVAFEKITERFPPADHQMMIAVGYNTKNALRQEKFYQAKDKGYQLGSYIHKTAQINGCEKIGENTLILENVIIQPQTSIGDNVTIWSNALVGHHSHVKDHCWLNSQSILCGSSIIGANTYVGVNATIGHEITIGKANFIGANCLVTKNTEDDSVFATQDTPRHRLNIDDFFKISKMAVCG